MKGEKGQVAGKDLIGLVLGVIMVFYVLSSTYPTLETSAISFQNSMEGNVTNETISGAYPENIIGRANLTGYINGTLGNPPLENNILVVYCNSTNLVPAANYSINVGSGFFEIVGTPGESGDTTNCANATVLVSYDRDTFADEVSNLPGVAVLLFILVVILGIVVSVTRL